jgi:transmembrane sensor
VSVGLLLVGVVSAVRFRERPAVMVEPREGGQLMAVERRDDFERWRVVSGSVFFDVDPSAGRRVQVDAEDLEVAVLGTRFLVEVVEGRVHVAVERGRVQVRGPFGERMLEGGASSWFPGHALPPAAASPVGQSPPPAPPSTTVVPSPQSGSNRAPVKLAVPSRSAPDFDAGPERAPSPTWQSLAQQGDFQAAWLELERGTPSDEPAELLLAADVARLSGHAAAAVALLERVLTAHSDDPRAPLAGFTLGRILLDDLGRPREAGAAFATVVRLAPEAPLAEDAAAREVESLFRAQSPEVRLRAEAFLKRYPASARLRAVRHFGGLP